MVVWAQAHPNVAALNLFVSLHSSHAPHIPVEVNSALINLFCVSGSDFSNPKRKLKDTVKLIYSNNYKDEQADVYL